MPARVSASRPSTAPRHRAEGRARIITTPEGLARRTASTGLVLATAVSAAAVSVGATTAPASASAGTAAAPSVAATGGVQTASAGQRSWSYKQRKIKAKRLQERNSEVLRYARSRKGASYRYGGTGPNSFDCSGLTKWAYGKAGKSLPRTSSQQASSAKRIDRRWAKWGDLVFFHNGGSVYHVGIYAGNNTIWHSPSTGSSVKREKIWSSSVYFGRV